MSYYLPIPKEVFQNKERFTCWAASLESWMSVTPNSPASWFIKTQDDAINEWNTFCDDNSGLDAKWGFALMAAAVGMNAEVFKNASNLTASFIYWKLKTYGHLYVFFTGGQTGLGNGLAHASVIYGISSSSDNGASVGVMDP